MNVIEKAAWTAFKKEHNHEGQLLQVFYEKHGTGLGTGYIAVCAVCLPRYVKTERARLPKLGVAMKDITDYGCW